MKGSKVRYKFPAEWGSQSPAPEPKAEPAEKFPSRAAMQLALAHHIERQIDAGVIADYAAAARALGLTRARLTQVTGLLLLSPTLQAQVLAGELRATEHQLRAAVKEPSWKAQAEAMAATEHRA